MNSLCSTISSSWNRCSRPIVPSDADAEMSLWPYFRAFLASPSNTCWESKTAPSSSVSRQAYLKSRIYTGGCSPPLWHWLYLHRTAMTARVARTSAGYHPRPPFRWPQTVRADSSLYRSLSFPYRTPFCVSMSLRVTPFTTLPRKVFPPFFSA